MKRLVLAAAVSLTAAAVVPPVFSDVSVRTVDFLAGQRLSVNAAGPVLLKMDEARNRLIAANTLTSSVTIIDCATGAAQNIAAGARALQHLKAEALALNPKNGDVYLIGAKCLVVAHPDAGKAETIPTGAQFESIAVDETTGNAFLAGRESKEIGFYKPGAKKLSLVKWLDHREDLINLNATPPPPIRKVVADAAAGEVLAVDGFTSALFAFEAKSAKLLRSRPLALSPGGRWHLAGYDAGARELFLVIETKERKVIEAARIDAAGRNDLVAPLPGFTEGVGVLYNPKRREVYIPYDNHPLVHVVDFGKNGAVTEIAIPSYGNDASALDAANDLLYIGSWAHGEVDVVDVAARRLVKRITDLGIIPHMFAMAHNPNNGLVYYPKGASAVNGTFGAAVTALDPSTGATKKIYTGWALVDLLEVSERNSFFVFNNEDEFAEVRMDGTVERRRLPYDFPVTSIATPDGNVYLSYGPHQSYWPVVYIWGAKNGILGIGARDLAFYDRRIPRQAQQMVFDTAGTLFFTQNLWGKEEQMLGTLPDEIRLFEIGTRVTVPDTIERENTQRLLRYDSGAKLLYLARVAEKDGDPGILHVIDPAARKGIARIALGSGPSDLVFDDSNIYVANFESGTVSIVDKAGLTERKIAVGACPLKLCRLGSEVYVINHADNTLQEARENGRTYRIPSEGLPDNLFAWGDKLVVTSHGAGALFVSQFDPATRRFALLHTERYPFGDTRFDSRNVSFYLSAQFGDAVYSITNGRTAADGRLWIADFLSGRLMIFERK